MSGSEHSSEIIVLSPSGRMWPFCVWAILFHVGIAAFALWLPNKTFLRPVEVGYPIEIIHLEEELGVSGTFSLQQEEVPEKLRSRLKQEDTNQMQEKVAEQGQEKVQEQKKMAKSEKAVNSEVEGSIVLSSLSRAPPKTTIKRLVPMQAGNPHPPYPDYARENAIEGKVIAILKVEVSTGIVQEVKITEPKAHSCLEESVVETVINWRFQPSGSYGYVEEIFPFEFRLTENP